MCWKIMFRMNRLIKIDIQEEYIKLSNFVARKRRFLSRLGWEAGSGAAVRERSWLGGLLGGEYNDYEDSDRYHIRRIKD